MSRGFFMPIKEESHLHLHTDMHTTPRELASILKVQTPSNNLEQTLTDISTDTRSLFSAKTSIFFALPGARHQGSQYISKAISLGVTNVVFEQGVALDAAKHPDINFYIVPNALDALQQIVSFKQREFSFSRIAITGSNGKTIVKEWLAEVLSHEFHIVKSPKSFNSQIGVPLSVWKMSEKHNLGIFEAGISMPNEMEKLERMIVPTYGLLTNLGSAHQENFSSLEDKLNEKLKLFYSSEVLILKFEMLKAYPKSFLLLKEKNPKIKFLSCGTEIPCNFIAKTEGNKLYVKYGADEMTIPVLENNPSTIENLTLTACVCLFLGKTSRDVIARFSELKAISMRLEKMQGIYQTTIINDTYNADLDSFKIALDFLALQGNSKKSLILSEISNLSTISVCEILRNYSLDSIVFIGNQFVQDKTEIERFISSSTYFYKDTDQFIRAFHHQELRSQTILIKGARSFLLDKISDFYKFKTHSTELRIHMNAIVHNLNLFSKHVDHKTKIMIMLKAQAYGLGSVELAKLLENQRVDYFAVAYTDEAIELRNAGIQTAIMVMNPGTDTFDRLIDYNLEAEVYSLSFLKNLVRYLDTLAPSAPLKIHLKIETGMHRLGIATNDIDEVLRVIALSSFLEVVGIFSHLAASDMADHDEFTLNQNETLTSVATEISDKLDVKPLIHLVNTSGIIRHPTLHHDMVRLGIGLFGFDGTDLLKNQLQSTISFVARIAQIKELEKNKTVGYNRNGKLQRKTKIAIVNVGYADGYTRKFGNGQASVWIQNQLFPTIGNICMDMIMIDITEGVNINEGDLVELMGPHVGISKLALTAETIPYEIITNISSRVSRVYIHD
jgi:Alr-MurF fusion protein